MFANRTIQLSFFFVVFGALAVLGFFIFKPYLSTIFLAATFAIVFHPLYKYFDRVFKFRLPSVASGLTVLIASLIIFVPATLIGTRVWEEGATMYAQISAARSGDRDPLPPASPDAGSLVLEMRAKLDAGITAIASNLDNVAQSSLDWFVQNAQDVSGTVVRFGVKFFIWFLSFYYLLRDGHRIRSLFIVLSPLSDKYDNEIADRVTIAVKSVVGGSLIVAVCQGAATGLGLWIFGVPTPVIWGALSILAALVPSVGTALVLLPAAAYLFLIGNTMSMIGLVIWGLVVVNLIDNILRPKLIQRGTKMHPLMVLLSVLGGIVLFGPVGFLIGPILVSLLMEFLEIYNEMVLHHRNEAFNQDQHAS